MALTPDERKMRLGHGGLALIARRTRRTRGHVTEVNSERRDDPVVKRAITREIVAKNPTIKPDEVWLMAG